MHSQNQSFYTKKRLQFMHNQNQLFNTDDKSANCCVNHSKQESW